VKSLFDLNPHVELVLRFPAALPQVRADKDRICQVVVNLIHNAAKFTDQGDVTVEAGLQPDGFVLVTVTDTGRGFAALDPAILFEKYHQDESTRQGSGGKGAGLGLPICKEIVEHYEGRIWAERAAEAGSRFCFTLPTVARWIAEQG